MIEKMFVELINGFFGQTGISPPEKRNLWLFVHLSIDRVMKKLTLLAESGNKDKLNDYMEELRDDMVKFHKAEAEITNTILKQYEESLTCDG
jgi:hypothetical protein